MLDLGAGFDPYSQEIRNSKIRKKLYRKKYSKKYGSLFCFVQNHIFPPFLQDRDGTPSDCDTKQAVKKGLLWHQKDKLFSR